MKGNAFALNDLFRGENLRSLALALGLLGLSFVAEHFANTYAFEFLARPTTSAVGDLLLDNLSVINLNFVIVECALAAIIVGVVYVVWRRPRYVLFSVKALALFIATRALFMSLTHVGIYPGQINPGDGALDVVYTYLNMQSGFFFSGHTGIPFLMGFVFRDRPFERTVLFAMSFIFGAAVLLAHIHYSIDVLAAPFMAYGVYALARRLFPRDYALTRCGHPDIHELSRV